MNMNTNEIIDRLQLALELCGDGGPTPFTSEEYAEMHDFLEAQRPKEYGHNTWQAGTKPEWKVGNILAYYECTTDHEGEYCIGKITNVEFDELIGDWVYEFEDGCGDFEWSLADDKCYTISEEYYNKHYKH